MITVTVTPGEVRIASIWLMRATDDMVWIMVDCSTKYPVFGCHGSNSEDDERVFCVDANETTIKVDESKRGTSTEVRVRGIPKGWEIVTDLGRYTGHIVALRPSDEDSDGPLWSDS